jgi:8-hydroxy-5-deazaflavin:NADPH oxidoreductase
MQIGIIGSGNIGGALAHGLTRAGHDVVLSNSRGPDTLRDQVAALGEHARAGTAADAAQADVVMVAVPLRAVGDLPDPALFDGHVVVDANNYYPGRDGQIAALDDDSTTSSELLAARLPGARVVKAFNTIPAARLRDDGHPELAPDDRPAIPIAGDDEAAKATVAALVDELGFTAVDHGALADGRAQQPGAEVYGAELTARDARAVLA